MTNRTCSFDERSGVKTAEQIQYPKTHKKLHKFKEIPSWSPFFVP